MAKPVPIQEELDKAAAGVEIQPAKPEQKKAPAGPAKANGVEKATQPFFTESPVSINTYWNTPKGANLQVTIRSTATSDDLYAAVAVYAGFEVWADEAGWIPAYKGEPARPAPQQQGKPAAQQPAGKPGKPAGKPGNGGGGEPLYTQEGSQERPRHLLKVVWVEVKPRTDSKVDVLLYGNTKKQPRDKYPTLRHVSEAAKAAELFSLSGIPFEEDEFSSAWADELHFEVIWEESERMTGQGNPYRDIVTVRPLSE
jgi:hypothetical protein